MATLDREKLFEHSSLVLERLNRHQQVTHFYYYDVDGELFLRVYQPENTRESTPRYTREHARVTNTIISGMELGDSGTFTLRVVAPWQVDGKIIGYIELGQEIDPILHELGAITQVDFVLVLYKQFLQQDKWEQGMELLGRSAKWNLHEQKVVIDKTLSLDSPTLKMLLNAPSLHQQHGFTFNNATFHYRARSFPLWDVTGKEVGEFILLKNTTEEDTAFRNSLFFVIGFSLLLSSALFVFAYRVLGRIDEQLVKAEIRLQHEFSKQKDMNQQLQQEVEERQRAESGIRILNETLETKVQERTQALDLLNQDLERSRNELDTAYRNLQAQQATILQQDKMACIGQLAAGVAHDINSPNGFVSGNLEILREHIQKMAHYSAAQSEIIRHYAPAERQHSLQQQHEQMKITEIYQDAAELITESLEGTAQINRTVVNLKGFSRSDDGAARYTDIHNCLESTLAIVANELRYKAEIIREYGELPLLYCYPQQLNQVFMNLLINASQAIQEWGTIWIRTWADDSKLYIEIEDTGSGMIPEQLTHIFEPFYTTKPVGVGTGLGLSIVQEIITRHHGTIQVKSKAGSGTTFTLSFARHNEDNLL